MKTLIITKIGFIILFLLFCVYQSFSQVWQPIGPTDITVNNYYSRIDMEVQADRTELFGTALTKQVALLAKECIIAY